MTFIRFYLRQLWCMEQCFSAAFQCTLQHQQYLSTSHWKSYYIYKGLVTAKETVNFYWMNSASKLFCNSFKQQ